MKLRYKILYMSFGAGLVVLGMMLNSLVSGDAEAQVGVKDATFGYITCKGLYIKDEYKQKGYFGLSGGSSAILQIYGGDDEKSILAYLGKNIFNEAIFRLHSKSKTDERQVSMQIDENGGRFDSFNKMGEDVIRLAVGSDGSGGLDLRDKYGYK